MAQISLIPLQEWIECPLRPTVTTLAAPVTMTPGDELILTPEGSTFNGAPSLNGRLPNAAELAGAPFYHVILRGYAAASGSNNADRLLVSANGEAYAQQHLVNDLVYGESTLYTYVSSEIEFLSVLAGALPNVNPTSLVAAFLIPDYPKNSNGEGLSLEQILRWQNAPLRPLSQNALTLTAGNPPTPLAVPSSAQRGLAPWGYLSVAYEAANPANPAGVLYYANGEPVPYRGESADGINAGTRVAPQQPVFARPFDWVKRFPWDLGLSAQAVTQDVTLRYTWLVPDIPDTP